MITTAKVKEHIAAVEAAMATAQKMPPKSKKREMAKWVYVRNSLLIAAGLVDSNPAPETLERQHAENVKKLNNYHAAKRSIPHDFLRKDNLEILHKQYNPTNLKKSLEFLNYILEKNDDLLCGVLSSVSAPA